MCVNYNNKYLELRTTVNQYSTTLGPFFYFMYYFYYILEIVTDGSDIFGTPG